MEFILERKQANALSNKYNSNEEISFLFIKSMFNIYNRIIKINSNEITDENIKKISNKYIKELIDNDE